MGFECPSRQTTADFLTAVTDPHVRVIRKRYEHLAPRTSDDFERAFSQSPDAKANWDAIAEFENEIRRNHPGDDFRNAVQADKAKHVRNKSVYTISFYQQVRACTFRQYQVLWGDKPTFIGKNFLTIFQALIVGSLFYNQPATSAGVFTRGGVMLYISFQSCLTIKFLVVIQRIGCHE